MFAWHDVKDCRAEIRRLENRWLGAKVTTLGYKQFGKDRFDLVTPPEIHKETLRITYDEHVNELSALRTRMKQLGCYHEYQSRWQLVREQMRDGKDLLMIHYDIIQRNI